MDIRVPDGWMLVEAGTQAEVEERLPKALVRAKNIVLHLRGLSEAVDLRKVCGKNALAYQMIGVEPRRIGWLIVSGGERPLHPSWVRSLRDQCVQAGVPFCFTGWGEWAYGGTNAVLFSTDGTFCHSDGNVLCTSIDQNHLHTFISRAGSDKSGRLLDGQVWDQKPEGL